MTTISSGVLVIQYQINNKYNPCTAASSFLSIVSIEIIASIFLSFEQYNDEQDKAVIKKKYAAGKLCTILI